jgi:eukaryotic-like serine/threonine-protein kinase
MSGDAGDRPELPGLELQELRVRTNLNEVWRGVRKESGAAVAVKLATTAAGPDALRQEAEIVHQLLGAGVSGVVSAEYRDDPVPHLILPWKGGRTLRDALDEARGSDDRSRNVRILLHVVEIVARAHREGFQHGDLKPENVLLDPTGRPWLIDFGMARAIRSARLDSHVSLSMSESAKGWGGTLHYLPPEGLQGDAPTVAWDVYALGVMLHEILLGRRPDRAATPEQLKSVLSEDVVQVLLAALAYAPEDRLRSARQLLDRLQAIGGELTAVGPKRWGYRGIRLLVVGLAAFFVALRFGTVAALLAFYAAIPVAAFVIHPACLFAYLPCLLFHLYIRWEGPETVEEAALRRSRSAISR